LITGYRRAVAESFFAAFGGREEGKIIGGCAPEPPAKGLAVPGPPDPVPFANPLSTP
jgi:hypothetical protein